MAMTDKIKTTTYRSANVVDAASEKIVSADGKRWACGRNVKAESARGAGYYEVVRVWALKTRNEAGKVITIDRNRSESEARAWIA